MNKLLLISWLFGNPVWALSEAKVHKKTDSWLINKIEKLDDREDIVIIINEMGIRRTPEFLPILIKFTNHPLDEIRRSALEALIAYGPSRYDDRRDQAYIDRLSDKNKGVASLAQKGILQRIQSEIKVNYLKNALLQQCTESTSWKDQLHIIEILKWVDGEEIDNLMIDLASQHTNPQVRRAAVSALGERRMKSARSLLLTIRNRDLDSEVREAAQRSLEQIGGKISDVVIAVMPFEVQQPELQQLAKGFQNYLSGTLSSAQLATFVERGQVDKVMAELIYQDANIDDSKAIEIGKSLRASQVITGTFQGHGNHITITIKLIEVSSQEILHSAQVSGLQLDFDALQRDAAARFIESF